MLLKQSIVIIRVPETSTLLMRNQPKPKLQFEKRLQRSATKVELANASKNLPCCHAAR